MKYSRLSMMGIKVLVADCQPKWLTLIRQALILEGFKVLVANNGEKAIQVVISESPSIILLDTIFLYGIDGFEVIRTVREFSDIPIIIISEKSDPDTILQGFKAGIDDYIIKPFNQKILLARIQAVLNRYIEKVYIPVEIVCNNLVIDSVAHRVFQDGEEVILTEKEYKLLLELAMNSNKVLLHEQLLCAVWGTEYKNEVMYLRSYIHMLRRKLEKDPTQPKLIINRSGIGYLLVSE